MTSRWCSRWTSYVRQKLSLTFLRSMTIIEDEAPCMVPTITEDKSKIPMLSTMQLEKGLKKNEVTYLAALKKTQFILWETLCLWMSKSCYMSSRM